MFLTCNRSLSEQDELRSLCDVFTYTTMISQCGSHHQLRRALELVAEMRSRVIGLNVHTYSALLNVCLKANELDLSLDIYAQMLSDGCTPNLVTYNTLVDIYGKLGRWADAVAVLDQLQQQVCGGTETNICLEKKDIAAKRCRVQPCMRVSVQRKLPLKRVLVHVVCKNLEFCDMSFFGLDAYIWKKTPSLHLCKVQLRHV